MLTRMTIYDISEVIEKLSNSISETMTLWFCAIPEKELVLPLYLLTQFKEFAIHKEICYGCKCRETRLLASEVNLVWKFEILKRGEFRSTSHGTFNVPEWGMILVSFQVFIFLVLVIVRSYVFEVTSEDLGRFRSVELKV